MRPIWIQVSGMMLLVMLLVAGGHPSQAQSAADVTVHFVEGVPQPQQFNYAVSVYFSVYYPDGKPVRSLRLQDVSITEDGRPVRLESLDVADEPIQVVLVIDTSGSMRGSKIEAAREAALHFISRMRSGDRAALLSFDTTVKTQVGLTDTLDDVRRRLERLDAVSGAGTCLYDALYEAIVLSASIPVGRRAIVLLTDGIDELPDGRRCSRTPEEEILTLAKSGLTRVPLYTIGLGNRVDSEALNRLAERTGGGYQFAYDEWALGGLFQTLSEHLRSQYRATYFSTASPGPHQVVVEVTLAGQPMRELREFTLPPFPYIVRFVSPQEGQTVTEAVTIQAEVVGQGVPVSRMEFFLGENALGSDSQPPYEYLWQPEPGTSGSFVLSAAIFDASGEELARGSTIIHVQLPPEPVPVETLEVQQVPETQTEQSQLQTVLPLTFLWVLGLVGAVAFFIVGFVLVAVWRQQKHKQEEERREREWREKVILGVSAGASSGEEATIDGLAVSFSAGLVVLQSDDAGLMNSRFELKNAVTLLGRKSDCDIVFPNEKPVSRHHARIENVNGTFYISEVTSLEADGSRKRPVYGTFVNDQQIEGYVRLRDGDRIRLGKRLVLRFDAPGTSPDDERTIDQIEGSTLG